MCILVVTRFLIIAVSSVFASSALKRFSGKNKFSEKHRRHPSSEIEKPLTAGDDRNENTFLITPLDELTLTAAAAAAAAAGEWASATLSHYVKSRRENEEKETSRQVTLQRSIYSVMLFCLDDVKLK